MNDTTVPVPFVEAMGSDRYVTISTQGDFKDFDNMLSFATYLREHKGKAYISVYCECKNWRKSEYATWAANFQIQVKAIMGIG